jgi:hypothetical protein
MQSYALHSLALGHEAGKDLFAIPRFVRFGVISWIVLIPQNNQNYFERSSLVNRPTLATASSGD